MAEKKTTKKDNEEKEELVKKTQTKKEEKTSTISGLDEKYEVILVYLISILGFIFSLMKDRKVSKNMRFNYNQAGTVWLVNIIFSLATTFSAFFIEPLRWISYPISLLLLIFSIIALIKAYNGERYEIPVIYDISKSIWGEEK